MDDEAGVERQSLKRPRSVEPVLESLVDSVLDRASRDVGLPEEAKLLILAALEGEDDLWAAAGLSSGQRGQGLSDRRPGPAERQPPPGHALPGDALSGDALSGDALPGDALPGDALSGDAVPDPARAFLSEVRVQGFRGVGEAAVLKLRPGPGLTVVAGRNGCGKSTFAEALEVALTQGSYRWRQRSTAWQSGWRNLHDSRQTSIHVELAEEGAGSTTVAATWAPDADFDAVQSWTQRRGHKRSPGVDQLGWAAGMEVYRPFLSYEELGAIFAEPSRLHDALVPILGLEQLEDAQTRLAALVKRLSEPATKAKALATPLRRALAGADDRRAARALALIKKRAPDLDAVAELVTGQPAPDPDLAGLKALADVTPPDPGRWRTAWANYRAALLEVTAAQDAAADVSARSVELLRLALDLHSHNGTGPCPVCGVGRLDDDWARGARATVEASSGTDERMAAARQALTLAERSLADVVPRVPSALSGPAELPGEAQLPGAVDALRLWQEWRDGPKWQERQATFADPQRRATSDDRWSDTRFEAVREAIERVVAQAQEAVTLREDAWQPLALALGEWLAPAREAATVQERLDTVTAAANWLRANHHELRNARLEPIAEQALHVWSLLKQESNVELESLRLEGARTRRRVDVSATVDGTDVGAGALAVMSQGELHALSLALFLPRVTSAHSPFGFVVIDDPVQAMDPAKVDGLARVLFEAAADRQVLVFTHDDRLPEAIRRLQLPARILEVTRDQRSTVSVSEVDDPARRYLDDARAIAADPDLGPDVARRVIPELCRLALESVCRDLYFHARLRNGDPRQAVEDAWSAARATRNRLALALHGSPQASIETWLARRPRKAALGICTSGPHTGIESNVGAAIRDVATVVNELEQSRARG